MIKMAVHAHIINPNTIKVKGNEKNRITDGHFRTLFERVKLDSDKVIQIEQQNAVH